MGMTEANHLWAQQFGCRELAVAAGTVISAGSTGFYIYQDYICLLLVTYSSDAQPTFFRKMQVYLDNVVFCEHFIGC